MSVSENLTPYKRFDATGGTAYPFTFPVTNADDLRVSKITDAGVETVLTKDVDYSVALTDDGDSGGTVTTDEAVAEGYDLLIRRDTEVSQGSVYTDGGRFPAQAHQTSLDKITMILQELQEQGSRTIRAPESDTSSTDTTAIFKSWWQTLPGYDEAKVQALTMQADGTFRLYNVEEFENLHFS